MPFIYKYQVDGNGDYVLDGGNKVILESYQYGEGAGLDWRRIASSTKKPPYIRSFAVRSLNNGDAWVLIINQKQLVGIYPSQDAALQILNGLFTRVSANDEAAREAMSHQLSKGGSSISSAGIDVVDIRLFTDAGRTDNVTANPPGNTVLYAYAYSSVSDPDSSPISGDVEFTYTGSITPGIGFSGDIAETTIDGGVSYTTAGDAKAMTWWSEAPIQLAGSTYGDSTLVAVVADHYNGIEKVGFIADNGDEVFVTTPTVTADGLTQYRAVVDMSGVTAGTTVEVRAIAYPNHGVTRVLQGEIPFDTSVDDTSKECNLGMKITKISSIQTTNVTTGKTLKQALIDLGDVSAVNTIQHRLVFSDAEVLGGEESNLNPVNDYVPVLIEGSLPDRGVLITHDTYNINGPFAKGAYELKNLTWDASSIVMRPATSGARQCYIKVTDCAVTDLNEELPHNYSWTDTDGVSANIDNNIANEKSLTKVTWTRAQRDGRSKVSAVTSNADDQRGVWLEDSSINCEMGDAQKWAKNCNAVNNLVDVFHGGCMLNIDNISATRGYDITFPLTNPVLNFVPGKTYADQAIVVGYDDTDPDPTKHTTRILRNNNGGPHSSTTFSVADGWTNNIAPHADGWQPRERLDPGNPTYGTFSNIWLEGMTTDNDSVIQPWLYDGPEILKDVMFKRFRIINTHAYTSSLIAQIFTPMHHWIIDSCEWWPDDLGTSGEMLISWDRDGSSGWGNPYNGQSVSCKYAKWKNSKIKRLIDSDWPSSPYPTLQAWVDDINSNAGNFVGWDLDVDAYTMANSYIKAEAPAAPSNVVVSPDTGVAQQDDAVTVSVSYDGTEPVTLTYAWTKDAVPVAGEDAATYPKTGVIQASEVGAVLVCTVTATNALGSDTGSHDYGAIGGLGGTLSDDKVSNPRWRSDGAGGGVFVNTDPTNFIGWTKIRVYDDTNANYGPFIDFDTDANEVITRGNLVGKIVTLTITAVNGANAGTDYVYTWAGEDFESWTTAIGVFKWATRTDSTATAPTGVNLYGDNPTYLITTADAPAPTDWDTAPVTYFHSTAGTIGYIFNTAGWDGLGQPGTNVVPETTSTSSGYARMNNTVPQGWNSDSIASTYPHVYVWTAADGWQKVTQVTSGGFKTDVNFSSATVTYSGSPDFAFAFYTTDQGDPSGWRAYDGPTS